MKDEELQKLGRRQFLQGTAVGAVGTAAAVVATGSISDAAADKPGVERAGYHETPHVRQVYQLSRF